jgi:hypothetical protein
LCSVISRRVTVEFLCGGDEVVTGSLAILFGWCGCFERAYSVVDSTNDEVASRCDILYTRVDYQLQAWSKHNVTLNQ